MSFKLVYKFLNKIEGRLSGNADIITSDRLVSTELSSPRQESFQEPQVEVVLAAVKGSAHGSTYVELIVDGLSPGQASVLCTVLDSESAPQQVGSSCCVSH